MASRTQWGSALVFVRVGERVGSGSANNKCSTGLAGPIVLASARLTLIHYSIEAAAEESTPCIVSSYPNKASRSGLAWSDPRVGPLDRKLVVQGVAFIREQAHLRG